MTFYYSVTNEPRCLVHKFTLVWWYTVRPTWLSPVTHKYTHNSVSFFPVIQRLIRILINYIGEVLMNNIYVEKNTVHKNVGTCIVYKKNKGPVIIIIESRRVWNTQTLSYSRLLFFYFFFRQPWLTVVIFDFRSNGDLLLTTIWYCNNNM